MKFNPKAKLDRSQVQDRRGQRRRAAVRPPRRFGWRRRWRTADPRWWNGIIGIVIVVIILIVAYSVRRHGPPRGWGSDGDQRVDLDQCETGADANDSQDCRDSRLGQLRSRRSGRTPCPSRPTWSTRSPTMSPSAGAPRADAAKRRRRWARSICPIDQTVYLDLTFFEDMLEGQLGGEGGDFAEAYVLAHEYGHHIQDLHGTLQKYQSRETGPTSPSVRIELQADCYAGVWARRGDDRRRTRTARRSSSRSRTRTSPRRIDAATAVGDDRIQRADVRAGQSRAVDARFGSRTRRVVQASAASPVIWPTATPSPADAL